MANPLFLCHPPSSFVACPVEPAQGIVFVIGCLADPVAVGAAAIHSNKNVGFSGVNTPYCRPMVAMENPILVVSPVSLAHYDIKVS